MESTYFAIQQAQHCIREGRISAAHIFLHDVNRPLEQQIAGRSLSPAFGAHHLGVLKGPLGWLAGYLVTAPGAASRARDAEVVWS